MFRWPAGGARRRRAGGRRPCLGRSGSLHLARGPERRTRLLSLTHARILSGLSAGSRLFFRRGITMYSGRPRARRDQPLYVRSCSKLRFARGVGGRDGIVPLTAPLTFSHHYAPGKSQAKWYHIAQAGKKARSSINDSDALLKRSRRRLGSCRWRRTRRSSHSCTKLPWGTPRSSPPPWSSPWSTSTRRRCSFPWGSSSYEGVTRQPLLSPTNHERWTYLLADSVPEHEQPVV